MGSDQGPVRGVADEQDDVVKTAAVNAALNVPTRTKSKSRKKSGASLLRLQSFDNLPDYLKDNE